MFDIKEARKLKQKEIVDIKKALISSQGFKCPLCRRNLRGIGLSKLALDHCHDSGYIRGVICLGCNRVEGIIKKAIGQWGKTKSRSGQVLYLQNLSAYLKDSIDKPIRLIYPRHKTEEEKILSKLKTTQKRRTNK